ncbi:MAG: M48 family metalloprotease [Bacteroidales bacterium]|nr:M48 family metalloprotease [Bacteroidales bacterium]
MKKLAIIAAAILTLSSCSALSKINWNEAQLAQAATTALTAASISDAQVIALSQKTVAELDAQNKLASETYQQRLGRLLADIPDVEGLKINYKVYETNEVNAFACGDGSIRVYSGLMDVMDDSELMAIIGHECGHVVHQDTKKAMRSAYLAAAAREAIGAAGGTIGALSNSVLGDIGESFISSQYSQKQEFEADEYGYKFSTEHGFSPYSMCNALEKLVRLAGSSQSSIVQKMFASHPDSAERAKRMRAKADATQGK